MTMLDVSLICFAAGSLIHAAQTVLVAKLWRHTSGAERVEALDGIAIGVLTFLWQFGNFVAVFVQGIGLRDTSLHRLADFTRNGALIAFPLLFSYICFHIYTQKYWTSPIIRFAGVLRYLLIPWTVAAITTLGAAEFGFWVGFMQPVLVAQATLHLMLVYFVIFTIGNVQHRPEALASRVPADVRAHKAGLVAAFIASIMFVVMLSGYWHAPVPFLPYIELAAMMTSVPFSISAAYRLYQFPFMDVFLREVLSGVTLLSAFVAAMAANQTWVPRQLNLFATVVCAILLAFAKAPVTRWVERTFLGHDESTDEQEERIGNAIRSLTRLDQFNVRVSEILRSELGAEWVEIGSNIPPQTVQRFEIPGSALRLSLGPRTGGRRYMSRELRVARTAALQLAAHHHQLTQHELRESTARAQMRALQAQIHPHFLFNTLNVLSNLIHTNPVKAERVTEQLAEIFRYALESTRMDWVTLDDELGFLESYLEIEKSRFEERLSYTLDVDASLRSLKIPPMILQPLVENAVKHGIGPKVEGGEVRIGARFNHEHLVLVVEDTGVGPHGRNRQRGSGIGLNNVRERLQHAYGESASLRLEEIHPGGTKVELVLPQLMGVPS
jgi:hypothetical protein